MDYPDTLPVPLQQGYAVETVSPLLRSTLASGRARQREIFDNVPQRVTAQWIFKIGEAQLFETWYRYGISNGADWFNMPLRTTMGCAPKLVRFADIYKGPTIAGPNLLRYTAVIDVFERETLPADYLDPDLGQFILYADIIDIALNDKWPEAS